MSFTRTLGGFALATLLLAGCDTTPSTGPLASQPTGTAESLLRQQQLQNMQADPSRAMQNGVVSGANVGTTGIVRSGDGTGTAGGNVTGQRADGTVERPGVGAPSTQGTAVNSTAKKKKHAPKPATTPAN